MFLNGINRIFYDRQRATNRHPQLTKSGLAKEQALGRHA
jgi:hypothetical protein